MSLHRSRVHKRMQVIAGEYVCRLGGMPPRLRSRQQHHQQFRSYLFLPVSWAEMKERVERWWERTESRMIEVTLLKRQQRETKWGTLSDRKRENIQKTRNKILPLPSQNDQESTYNSPNAYERWKTKRKKQYHLWKNTKREQYQLWKFRRRHQYEAWNAQRKSKWIKTRQVPLDEYSKAEWFDKLGRPLTARDATGRFVNPWQSQSTNGVHSVETLLRWKYQRFVRESIDFLSDMAIYPILTGQSIQQSNSSPLLRHAVPPLPLSNNSNLYCTWIGHSTCLFQLKTDFTILTDPIFSKRASPFERFIGVQREVPPAFTIQELVRNLHRGVRNTQSSYPPIDICCITHDHYDHLDKKSVEALKDHVQLWVVPTGIRKWLSDCCSINSDNVVELQWWQQLFLSKQRGRIVAHENDKLCTSTRDGVSGEKRNEDDMLAITCCPSSHWAGRTMFDRNLRLWCSFSFSSPSFNFFFCGDTGYPESFPLFRQIGDALGPFDLACIPIGAYEPRDMNKDSHCNPQEAVLIHKDLQSKKSLAIHWGSFQLTEEPMDAPPRDLKTALCIEDIDSESFSTLGHGHTFVVERRDQ